MAEDKSYLDPSRSIDERVEDLLARMTPEEKAGMMFQTMVMITPDGEFNPDVGAFWSGEHSRDDRQAYDALQSPWIHGRGSDRRLGQSIAEVGGIQTAGHSRHAIDRPAAQLR